MFMKLYLKLLSLVLACLMLTSLLAGCGGKDSSETDSTNRQTETETETTPTEEIVKEPSLDAYYIIEAVAQNGRNGLANGWNYDNRFDLTNATGLDASTVYDNSDDKFYRLIRDFDAENDGILKLEMIINAQSSDECIYIAMCDGEDNKLFYLTVKGGKWAFVGSDEIATQIPVVDGGQTESLASR